MTFKEQVLEILDDKKLKYKSLDSLYRAIAKKLNVNKDLVINCIVSMTKSGEITEAKGRLYTLKALKLKKGEVAKKSKDYLFVKVPGYNKDFYVPAGKTKGALSGDIVLVKVSNGGSEAEIVNIVEKVNKQVVGILKKDEIGHYVETGKFLKPVYIQPKLLNGAEENDYVVTKVLYQPASSEGLQGEIAEVLGKADSRAVLEKGIIAEFNLPTEYSEETLDQCEHIPTEVTEKEKQGRLDLTKETIFTIDGADARDLDDAVSIKKFKDGSFELGVHIADVGNYVKVGSPIDEDAYLRGTSVYFPDFVLPMLPKKLSNGICSLNPNVERLALSCIMKIDKTGKVTDHKICESVIKSSQRFTYDEVFAIMNGDKEMCEKYAHLKDDVLKMHELSTILKNARKERGSLDFDIPEAEFEMSESGEVLDIHKRVQNEAHNLIERFMVIANETVAKHFNEKEYPFVYRVHENPSNESVAKVLEFIEQLGYNRIDAPKKADPQYYQKLIKLFEGKDEASVLNKVLLMSLKKAKYL